MGFAQVRGGRAGRESSVGKSPVPYLRRVGAGTTGERQRPVDAVVSLTSPLPGTLCSLLPPVRFL
jgi:hypothetical protein